MKLVPFTLLLAGIILSSCSSSFENDAKKLGRLQCSIYKANSEAASPEKDREVTRITIEMGEHMLRMNKKYGDFAKDEEKQKIADEVISAIMNECK